MADQKITQLTELTTPALEDLFAIVDDPGGSPTTKKVTGTSLSQTLFAPIDGWVPVTDTWTYASASTFTISGVDRTAVYTKGTRLKFTQTTDKYAVVVGSSFSTNTTVTIAVNTDYTIANAAITSPYYSYQASPQGYPTRFAYTSTVSGSGGSAGTFAESVYASYFSVIGNQVFLEVYKDVSNKGSWTANFQVALPVASASTPSYFFISAIVVAQNGSTTHYAMGQVAASDTNIIWDKNGNGYVQWSDLTATFRVFVNGNYFI